MGRVVYRRTIDVQWVGWYIDVAETFNEWVGWYRRRYICCSNTLLKQSASVNYIYIDVLQTLRIYVSLCMCSFHYGMFVLVSMVSVMSTAGPPGS